jgi:uncharacterized membrane protein
MIKKNNESEGSPKEIHETTYHDQIGLERLIFFSDAVFAIAVTLLALEIRLPVGVESLNDTQLSANLLGAWHKYLAYLISFLVIGTFWMSHHRKFRYIKRYNSRLMMLNLLILMVVAFIPFPSSIISINGSRTATIFYAGTMTLAGLFFTLLWWYASKHNRLIESHITKTQRMREFMSPLTSVAIFILSIFLAFWDVNIARFSWLLILPASVIVTRK